MVESFFATRLNYVPKNLFFSKTYEVKMKTCALHWNESHVSERYKRVVVDGTQYRKNWERNVHRHVLLAQPVYSYIEKRGWRIPPKKSTN